MKSSVKRFLLAAALALASFGAQAQEKTSINSSHIQGGWSPPVYTVKTYHYNDWFNLDGVMVVCETGRKKCVEVEQSMPKGYNYEGWRIEEGRLLVLMRKRG